MICTSIVNQPYEACKQLMAQAEMVELRIDRLDLSQEQLHALISQAQCPVIATCREGKHSQSEREELLTLAADAGATYLDIELDAEEAYMSRLASYASQKGCKIIISHHDFEKTPDVEELNRLVSQCKGCKADLVKLITTAKSQKDAARILSLYSTHSELVAFAMGNHGKITRLACILLGAPFTYASATKGMESADGQIASNDMRQCLAILTR